MPTVQALSIQVTQDIKLSLMSMYRHRLSQEHRVISQVYKWDNPLSNPIQADPTIVELLLNRPERRSLHGTVLKYEEPLEPVAEDEWEASR